MKFDYNYWEFLIQNKYLRDKKTYELTEQKRLDLIYFKEWIRKEDHTYSFLKVRNFQFENIGKFLFVPFLVSDKDYKFFVAGTPLRIIGTRDIYNLFCYINSGLSIYPSSNVVNAFFFNAKKNAFKKTSNLRFQNISTKSMYDYNEIKESTYFLTYFEGLDKKGPIVLKKKLQSVYLSFILLRLLEIIYNLNNSIKSFQLNKNLDINKNLDQMDSDLNFYLLNLKSMFSKNRKLFSRKLNFKKGMSCFFFQSFNLLERSFSYNLNKCLFRFKMLWVKKRKFVFKKKKKLRIYKLDLPLIKLNKVYIHPYKISKFSSKRRIKRMVSLGKKKFVSLKFKSSSFNSRLSNFRDKKNKYRKSTVIDIWKSNLKFIIDKNDWSSAQTVYWKYFNKINKFLFPRRKLKTRLNKMYSFQNKILNKLFYFWKNHMYKHYQFFWKPKSFLTKFRYFFYKEFYEADPEIIIKKHIGVSKNTKLQLKWVLYKNIFWNPEIFDKKIYKELELKSKDSQTDDREKFMSVYKYGFGPWDWNFRTIKLGNFLYNKLDSRYDIDYKYLLNIVTYIGRLKKKF